MQIREKPTHLYAEPAAYGDAQQVVDTIYVRTQAASGGGIADAADEP